MTLYIALRKGKGVTFIKEFYSVEFNNQGNAIKVYKNETEFDQYTTTDYEYLTLFDGNISIQSFAKQK